MDDGTAELQIQVELDNASTQKKEVIVDILVEGEKRFAIEQLLHDKSYLSADVRVREDQHSTPDESLRQRLITQHMKLVELAQRVLRPGQYDDVEHLSFFIAHNAGLNLEQKQQVLELDNEAARVGYLVNHLEQFIPSVKEQEEIRRRVQSNGDLRDFPSRNA